MVHRKGVLNFIKGIIHISQEKSVIEKGPQEKLLAKRLINHFDEIFFSTIVFNLFLLNFKSN